MTQDTRRNPPLRGAADGLGDGRRRHRAQRLWAPARRAATTD